MNNIIASNLIRDLDITSMDSVLEYLNHFRGEDMKELALDYYQKDYPGLNRDEIWEVLQGNKGWLGQFVEQFFFGTSPNSKPERDLPCAELKTMQLKTDRFGYYMIKDHLKITKANRNDLCHKTFGRHKPLQSKLKEMILVYIDYNNYRFIKALPFELNSRDTKKAKNDYNRMVDFAHSTGNLFYDSSFGLTPKDSVLTLRSAGNKKNFALTKQTLRRYHLKHLNLA